jgi:hypothetical protein
MSYNVGDIVDLNDLMFGWRGQYIVVTQKAHFHLVKIKNLGTNSQQFVSPDRLRRSRLQQFFIKSLQIKP